MEQLISFMKQRNSHDDYPKHLSRPKQSSPPGEVSAWGGRRGLPLFTLILFLALGFNAEAQWTTKIQWIFGRARVLAFGILFLVFGFNAEAQWMLINQNGGTPDGSAALEVESTSRGFLAPRLNTTQMNAVSSPAAGLLIYNTDSSGFFFNNGSGWASISSAGATQFAVPAGSILPFGGDSSNIPAGFLLCNGASLDTSSYSELYAAIGSAWGGSGSNFNLPDLRGRFIRGTAYGSANDPDRSSRTAINTGGNTGDKVGSQQGDATARPNTAFQTNTTGSHSHTVSNIVGPDPGSNDNLDHDAAGGINYWPTNVTSSASGNHSHSITIGGDNETRPINANVNYIICYSSSIAAAGTNSSVFQGQISASQLPNNLVDSTRIADADGSTKVKATGAETITFTTSGSEAMRIASNGYVGLNTNNPQQLLDVAGTAVIDSLRIYNAYSFPGYDGTANQVLRTDGSGNLTWVTPASGADNLGNHTATTNIQLNGNYVSNDGGNEGLSIDNTGLATLTPATTGSGNRALTAKGDIITTGAGTGYLIESSNISMTGNVGSSGDLRFKTNNQARMRILNSGFIGIGTTTPTSALTLGGDSSSALTILSSVDTKNTGMAFQNSGGNYTWAIQRKAVGGANADLVIRGGNNNAAIPSLTERVRFKRTGEVGIGTDSPDSMLSVAGGIEAQNIRLRNGAAANRVLTSDAQGNASWQAPVSSPWLVNGSDVYRSSGNVGIGTNTPSSALEIDRDGAPQISISPTTTNTGQISAIEVMGATNKSDTAMTAAIHFGNFDQDFSSTKYTGSISGEITNDAQNEGDLVFYRYPNGSTPNEAIRIARFGTISFNSGNNAYFFPTTRGSNNQVLTTNGSGVLSWQTPASSPWITSGSDVYRVSGNVGIGTSTPSVPLDLTGQFRLQESNDAMTFTNTGGVKQATIGITDGNGRFNIYQGADSSGNYYIQNGEAASRIRMHTTGIHFYTAPSGTADNPITWSENLTILNGGSVGIGTDTPDSALTVSGGIKTTYFTMTSGTSLNGKVLTSDTSGVASWQSVPGDNLGNHEATQNIDLNGKYLSNDGGNDGIKLANDGLTTIESSNNTIMRLEQTDDGKSAYLELVGSRPSFASTNNLARIDFKNFDSNSGAAEVNLARIGAWSADNTSKQGNLRFETNAGSSNTDLVEAMVITTSQLVGIGKSNPVYELDVNGDIMANGDRFLVSDSSGALVEFSGTQNTSYRSYGAYVRTNTNPPNGGSIFRVLSSGGAERLRVEHNGVVSMANALRVEGNTDGTFTDSTLVVAGGIDAENIRLSNGAAANSVLTSDANGNASWQATQGDNMGNHQATQNIRLNNRWLSNDGGNEGIRISNTGNVGIGTATMNGLMQFPDVNERRKIVLFQAGNNIHQFGGFGTVANELVYQVPATTADHVWQAGTSASNSTELVRFTGDGYVGIKNASPNAPLQFANGNEIRKIVLHEATNNNFQIAGFGLSGGNVNYSVHTTTRDHIFYAGASSTSRNELFRITGTGNVGIGISSPTADLDVRNSSNSGFVKLNSSGGGIELGNGTTTTSYVDFRGSANLSSDYQGRVMYTDNFGMGLYVGGNSTPGLFVKESNGYVGIGTTSPIRELHLHNSTAPYLQWSNSTTGATATDGFQLGLSGNNVFFRNYENGALRFRTQDQNRLVIEGNGRVGVGTASPQGLLHVSGGEIRLDNNQGLVGENSSGTAVNFMKINASDNLIIGNNSGYGDIRIHAKSQNNAVVIDSAGYVGIGTTNPFQKLHVDGVVQANGGLKIDNATSLVCVNAAKNNAFRAIRATASNILEIGDVWQALSFNVNSQTNAMYIKAGGDIGMGTTNPGAKLQVVDNKGSNHVAMFENTSTNTGANGIEIQIGPNSNPGSGNNFIAFRDGDGTKIGEIEGSGGGAVVYNTTSDRRLKTNIRDYHGALALIDNIQPRLYERKSLLGKDEIGFIAQELQKVLPQLVSGDSSSNVEEEPMMVDYGNMTPVLTAGIKELHELVKQQQEIINGQQERIEQLEAKEQSYEELKKSIECEQKAMKEKLEELEKLMIMGQSSIQTSRGSVHSD